jgi:hypothetical protein
LEPRFAGSNLAEDDGFLRAIKVRSTTPFGGEVKPSVSYRKVYGVLKNPVEYERDTPSAKFTSIYNQGFT